MRKKPFLIALFFLIILYTAFVNDRNTGSYSEWDWLKPKHTCTTLGFSGRSEILNYQLECEPDFWNTKSGNNGFLVHLRKDQINGQLWPGKFWIYKITYEKKGSRIFIRKYFNGFTTTHSI